MSARNVIPMIPAAIEHGLIPVYLSPDVRAAPFLRALAAAGLVYRHEVARKVVIIEPARQMAEETHQ